MNHLVVFDDKAYLVDMSAFKRSMFEPMPMIIEPPPALDRLRFFCEQYFAPVIMVPSFILTSTYEPESEWKFAYLFPLGKRAYVKRK